MSDAQKDILKLLADKVISVDEAERLLKALNEGEHQKEENRSRFDEHHHNFRFHSPVSGIFETLGETFSEIGPLIKQSVEDVMSGVMGDDLGEVDEEELESEELVNGTCIIKPDTHLILIHDWKTGGNKEELRVQGVSGDVCRVLEAGATNVKVRRNPTHVIMQWSEGPLTVEVPETVSMLRARMKGGNIYVQRVGCDMTLKTLGGNLELRDLHKNFSAKTLGGNLLLSVEKDWQGHGRAQTMGGNIELVVPFEGTTFKVKAITMGGTVKVDKDLRSLETKQSFPGKCKTRVQVGEGESDSSISLKTMGGDIEVRRGSHEQ